MAGEAVRSRRRADIVIAVGQSAAGVVAGGVHGFAPTLTSFVGRATALAEVAGLLEQHRLVTVTGPGGSGKTRLAAEVARQTAGRFADGVWLAELALVRDPAQVPAVVAAALGVREWTGTAVADAVARVLAGQQVLLVLDNCEHVVGAAGALCAGLLLACDDVRVLATSREPLYVAGEVRYRLAPLALPSLDDLAHLARTEAVALFVDRARSADAHFALNDQTGPVVARLVRHLDGMPLAIELAAARVEALGVTQLLDHLGDRFDLLTVGDRAAAARQRSLAATVEWSYQLLDEGQRRVFRQVSVFPGPFTLEAAVAVAGPDAGPAVLHLVDCSLLVPPREDPDGRSRYVMLETLRAYASRLLADAGEQEDAAATLAGYAVRVAEQAAAGLETTTAESAAARWLDAEDATMRQVLAWTMEQDPAVAVRLAVMLAPWWYLRGRLVGEYPLLREVAGRAEVGGLAWCAAQCWLGWTAIFAADLAGALGHFAAVCDIVGTDPPPRALAECLGARSVTLTNLSRFGEAADDARRCLALAREFGYPAAEALALMALALTTFETGDTDGALHLARQAEQVPADIPGWIARLCSDALASRLHAAGDLAAADRSYAAGMARARDAGDLRSLATQLPLLVLLDLQLGRLEDAAEHLRELLQLAPRTGRLDVFNGLECCGHLCAATGRSAEAITMWAAYSALLRRHGLIDLARDIRRRDKPLRAARQALGEAQTRAAEDRGAAMSLATAAEYALMLTAPAPRPHASQGLAGLSARECELVTLVAQGRTDAQIAGRLSISIRTVRSHLDRIRDKTGCRRRADLTRLALTAGLV